MLRYSFFENQLGKDARLGAKFYFLNPQGEVIREGGFNEKIKKPMASVKKVAIALCTLKKIFENEEYSLNDLLKIDDSHFSPGPPWNPLDRYFFIPWETEQNKSLDELITIMLKNSDNTATDVLINYVGGITSVNNFVKDLGIDGYNLTVNSKKLLFDYYEVSGEKSISRTFQCLFEFLSAYNVRPIEKSMVLQEYDSCTPDCMNNLLRLILIEAEKNQKTWLSQASKLVYERMQLCVTADDLVRTGAKKFDMYIKQIGDKNGNFGGVNNDSAYIKFVNGNTLILSIFTCLSPHEFAVRSKIIADITQDILEQNKDCFIDVMDEVAEAFTTRKDCR
jgi:beta-lactamase class A